MLFSSSNCTKYLENILRKTKNQHIPFFWWGGGGVFFWRIKVFLVNIFSPLLISTIIVLIYFFPEAKHVMMGSRKTMLMMNGLFIPFGALILVMYDKARMKYKKDNVN